MSSTQVEKALVPKSKYQSGYMQCVKRLHSDMSSLLSEGKYSDLTIVCKGVEFRVHRAILLPRCNFFRACFDNDFKENAEGVIVLDEDDCAAVGMSLSEIYTRSPSTVKDHFDINKDINIVTLAQTWKIADKLELPNLTQQCLAYLQTEANLKSLRGRSGNLWMQHILLGLSDTKGMRTSDQGGMLNTEMRDQIKQILYLSSSFLDTSPEEEEILLADPELMLELLKYKGKDSTQKSIPGTEEMSNAVKE